MTDSVGEGIQEDNVDKTAIVSMNVASYNNVRQRHRGEEVTERSSSRTMASPCSSSRLVEKGLVAPLSSSQQSPSDSERIIRQVGPYDILVGRSSECFNNIGNRRFRLTISLNMSEYINAKTRDDKSWVIASVLRKMRQEAGYRFLKKVTVASSTAEHEEVLSSKTKTSKTTTTKNKKIMKKKKNTGSNSGEISHYYVEVSEKKMREKVGHALRDLSVQLLQPQSTPKSPATSKSASSKKKVGRPSGKKSKIKKISSVIKKPKVVPSTSSLSPSSKLQKGSTHSVTPIPPLTTSATTAITADSIFSKRRVSFSSPLPVPELKDIDEENDNLNCRKFGNGGGDVVGGGPVDSDDDHSESLNDIWSKWDKDAPHLDEDPFVPSTLDNPDDTDLLLI